MTQEEEVFLEALRNSTKRAREVVRMLPTASLVTLALVHRVAMAGKGCRDFEKLKNLLIAETLKRLSLATSRTRRSLVTRPPSRKAL